MKWLWVKSSILLILFTCTVVVAQDENPGPTTINYITVNSTNNTVEINWLENPSPFVDYYVITRYFEEPISAFDSINFVDKNTLTYIDPDATPHLKSEQYKIRGANTNNRGILGAYHQTIFLEYEYDSCAVSVNLNWTAYEGWENGVDKYIIYQVLDQAEISLGETTDLNFNVSGLSQSTNYTFFIEAVQSGNNSIKSRSNQIQVFTQVEAPPSFINADQSSALDESVTMQFSWSNDGETTNFAILKSQNEGNYNDTIHKFETSAYSYNFTDNTADLSAKNYYVLAAINSCRQSIAQSNPTSNMVLSLSANGNTYNISWSEYSSYNGITDTYQIFRVLNNSTQQVGSVDGNTLNFTDNISEINLSNASDVCYYVSANETNNPYGVTGTSFSNILCIPLKANVFMPNAFSPVSTNPIDQTFGPVTSLEPESFYMEILTRQGETIFTSNDFNIFWNGTTSGGQLAEAGIYIYYVEITFSSGKSEKLNGTLTLLY